MSEDCNGAETTQESPNLIAVRRRYEGGTTQGAHWHSNASELVYCLSGSGNVQITLPSAHGGDGRVSGGYEMIKISNESDSKSDFGASAFIPQGYLHDIIPDEGGIEVMIIFNAANANTFEKRFVFP